MDTQNIYSGLRPAANFVTTPARKSPFRDNLENNPLGGQWSLLPRSMDEDSIISWDGLPIGTLKRADTSHVWPLINIAVNGAPQFTRNVSAPHEITSVWIYRFGSPYSKLVETSPHFQIIDEKTGAVIFTSNIMYASRGDRELIENFGKLMTELLGSLQV